MIFHKRINKFNKMVKNWKNWACFTGTCYEFLQYFISKKARVSNCLQTLETLRNVRPLPKITFFCTISGKVLAFWWYKPILYPRWVAENRCFWCCTKCYVKPEALQIYVRPLLYFLKKVHIVLIWCISDSKMADNYIYMAFLVVYKLGIQKLKIRRINKV